MMGRKKIGLTSGLNPLPALKMKSCLIGVGAKLDLPVEVVESNAELPLDAPTPRIALADRKITALIALEHLQRQGCEAAVLADIKSEPFLDELRKELLGTAVPQDFFAEHFGPAVKWVSPNDEMKAEFAKIQNPCEGLRRNGLTPAFKAYLVKAGHELMAQGAEVLIPNCSQMARFVEELQAEGLPVEDLLSDAAEMAVASTPARRPKPFKVGLIGGLGPAATVDLYDKIVKATPAKTDQEHIKLVVEQNPQIPDRTACLLNGGEDPTLALFHCAQRLEADGCSTLIVPCNTAHAFLPYLERFIKIPFINMQQAALDEIQNKLGTRAKIGLLATTGTVQTGIYGDKANAMGLPMFVPDDVHQERVMAAIYGPQGAKAGYTNGICREDLISAAEYLVKTHGCNCLILGCT
ncbi:MAG: aspartate racemase, partial [Sutterella sp. 54_7]